MTGQTPTTEESHRRWHREAPVQGPPIVRGYRALTFEHQLSSNNFRPQLRRGMAERIEILIHSRQHHLAIRLQLRRGIFERIATLLHGRQHHLAIRLQLRRGSLSLSCKYALCNATSMHVTVGLQGVDGPNFISRAFRRRSRAEQAAKRVHYGASGRHTGAVMTYVQCHSLTPPIDGHNRPHCVRSDFQNSKISNIRPNLEHFGAFERVGGPGRRSRLLPRYPRGV